MSRAKKPSQILVVNRRLPASKTGRFKPKDALALELAVLVEKPEFQTNYQIGGAMPAEMVRKNALIKKRFAIARAKLIGKYGLTNTYSKGVVETIKRLEKALAEQRADLALLRKYRKYKP